MDAVIEDDAGNDVFRRALKSQMKLRNVSAAELSRRLKINRATIHYWLSEDPEKRTTPVVGFLTELARALGCSRVDLLTDPDLPIIEEVVPDINAAEVEQALRVVFAKIGLEAKISLTLTRKRPLKRRP